MTGRTLESQSVNNQKISVDVSDLNHGIYLIRLNDGKAIPFSVVR